MTKLTSNRGRPVGKKTNEILKSRLILENPPPHVVRRIKQRNGKPPQHWEPLYKSLSGYEEDFQRTCQRLSIKREVLETLLSFPCVTHTQYDRALTELDSATERMKRSGRAGRRAIQADRNFSDSNLQKIVTNVFEDARDGASLSELTRSAIDLEKLKGDPPSKFNTLRQKIKKYIPI